jgi:hypothetical protein
MASAGSGKFGLTLLLGVVLAACGGSERPAAAGRPVIVPPTTKVTDATTRTALTAYDASTGTMRFGQSTPVLANLKLDDVLVSEPSDAAPNGYLRKVKAIRSEGTEVVIETSQANLTDAVSQGDLIAQKDLEPEDLGEVKTLVPGLTIRSGRLGAIDVGDGYRFQAKFDETLLDVGEGDVSVKVRVNGEVYFNAGYNIGIGIDNIAPTKGRFIPKVDRFEAWMGFDQAVQLRVSGQAHAAIVKEKKVAEIPFKPACFAFGPIPVCVVPTVYLFVGGSGEVSLSFDYAVTQKAQAKIGAKWDDNDGWSQIKPTPDFSAGLDQKFDVGAELNLKAWAKTEAALKIWDVAGPTIGAKLGLEVDAKFRRNPFWIARAQLEAYYGFIVDLPIIGRLTESSSSLYSLSKDVATSPNASPVILVKKPFARVDLGQPLNLTFLFSNDECIFSVYCVFDPEDGVPAYTLTSDVDGPLAASYYTFSTAGVRQVTIGARDSQGATATGKFTVEVVNTPPVVFGSLGSDTVQQTVPFFIGASTSDPNSKLGCSALTWSAQAPDTVEPANISADVCYGRAVFNVKGSRTVTLTAQDPQGAVSTPRTFTVWVTDPPPNPPPNPVQPLSVRGFSADTHEVIDVPDNGKASGPFTFSISATDPDGVTYIFSARCPECPDLALQNWREIGRNTTGSLEYNPPQSGTWNFAVIFTDGFSTPSFGRTVQVVPVPPH